MNTSHGQPIAEPATHTIRLYEDGNIVEGLTIENVMQGDRDEKGTLVQEGGVTFRMQKTRKLFTLPFGKFSFVINHQSEKGSAS